MDDLDRFISDLEKGSALSKNLHPIWPTRADEIMLGALRSFGSEQQEQIAFGECGEFVALAGLKAQGRLTREQAIDEIADVLIMMRQMAHVYGLEDVNRRIEFKLNRLDQTLKTVS